MFSQNKTRYTLGLYQSRSGLRGALVRHGERTEVVRLFGQEPSTEEWPVDQAAETPFDRGIDVSYGGDGSSSASDIFLSSEFGQPAISIEEMESSADRADVEDELGALVDRCRRDGAYPLELVWCLGTDQFVWTDVQTPTPSGKGMLGTRAGGSSAAPRRSTESSVFVPLVAKSNTAPRIIACRPRTEEPASRAIAQIRERSQTPPELCVVDTEFSALFALARIVQADETQEGTTFVVRVNGDDVLVLIVVPEGLEEVVVLRSLSIHDGPEVLCSRVLLLKDEYGVTDLERIYLNAPDADQHYAAVLRSYFRGVQVADLGSEIGPIVHLNEHVDSDTIPALGAAFRSVLGLEEEDNMLAPSLRRQRRANPFSWDVWLLLVILSATVVFFAGRFIQHDADIRLSHSRIKALTHDSQAAALLRHRIDSLQTTYSVNMQGLSVMDSLLVGSDRWSRMFDRVTTEILAVGDIWIETWRPAGSVVDVSGRAGSRDRIVELARRLDGTIEEITYAHEEQTYYGFRIKLPASTELPVAAHFLRKRAAEMLERGEGAFTTTADGTVTSPATYSTL